MKIKLSLSSLNEALGFASIVKPMNKEQSAYLFTVQDGRCYLHSQDGEDYVRTEVPLIEGEDGTFVYPADRVEALKYLDGWIEIEATEEDDGRFLTSYRTESGAKAVRSTYDPRVFNTMNNILAEAATEHTYPTVLLKEGLSVVSGYLAKDPPEPDSALETLQIFDASNPDWAKGDGTMYAMDGSRACYFHSPSFAGKGLAIHSKHVSRLSSFLAKCQNTVKAKIGKTMTFVIDQVVEPDGSVRDGAVFGWLNFGKTHQKYKYYPSKFDKFRLVVPRDYVLKTLKHIRSELKDAKREKVRVVYSDKSLKFVGSVDKGNTETAPVVVDPLSLGDGVESGSEFSANANVNFLIGLFEASREHNVEFRVAFLEDNKKRAFFRTIGTVWIGDSGKSYNSPSDAKESCYECLVTHFATSMD